MDNLCEVCQTLNPDDGNFMTLKSAFKTEATKFMKKFHEERLKKIDIILENETWKQTQVPGEFQYLVNAISTKGSSRFIREIKFSPSSSRVVSFNPLRHILIDLVIF